jgi:putative MATE family efflux protein
MSEPPSPRDENTRASREVEEHIEELGDPEASPGNPTSALAVGAAPAPQHAGPRTGTTREIVKLAWPVMLSMALASVVGLVDIAMVGRLGSTSQAAVGFAQQMFFIAQSALFAVSFAGVALMARAIGAGDPGRSRRVLAASLVISLGIAFVLFATLGIEPTWLLSLIGADEAVVALATPYMRLVMGSTILTSVALMIESGLRADKDTVTPLLVTSVLTVVKITLNFVFMFGWAGGPEWGVTGAGVATLVSQAVAVAIFVGISVRKPRDAPTALRIRDFRGIRPLIAPLVRIAAPSVFERLIMNFAMLVYFGLIADYGTTAIAAYTIGIRILAFSWIPGTGYSQAVSTIVGQELGAGNSVAAERAGWRAARLALGTAIVMGGLGALFRAPLAEAFTVDAETVVALGPFMLCLSLAQPAMQLHFTLAGAFRGAGDTVTPLWSAVVGNWVFRVPLAALVVFFDGPLTGLWVVLIFDHISRAIWMVLGFRRGTWRVRGERAAAKG